MKFWSHVAWSTKFSLKEALAFPTLNWSSKTKVCNFKIILAIKHQIFWFKISVRNTLKVHVVQSLHELHEEVSCKFFVKLSGVSNKIK